MTFTKSRQLICCIALLSTVAACRKHEPESFTNASVAGSWRFIASGTDLNRNKVFDANERIADTNGFYWKFLDNDTLLQSNRPDNTGFYYKQWYHVDGRKMYFIVPGNVYSEITELSENRLILLAEVNLGNGPEWTELQRL